MKVELFRATLWPKLFPFAQPGQWRVRINGKWKEGDASFTMTEVMRQLRGWMAMRIKKRGRTGP